MEQYPDGFAPHLRYQLAFQHLLGHQPHAPARRARRRITTHHRNDPLLFGRIEDLCGARPRAVEERLLDTAPAIALRGQPDSRLAQSHHLRDLRRAGPAIKLEQGHRAHHHPHLLESAPEHPVQALTVRRTQSKRRRRTSHADGTGIPLSPSHIFITFHAVKDLDAGHTPRNGS